MMKRHFKTQRVRVDGGFSMVECMVVLAVLGILAAIAVPSFNAWVPNYQLKNAAGDVYSALHLAKLTAVKENANVVVWFNTAGNNYRAYVDDGAGGGSAGNNTQDGTERTLREGTLEANVVLTNDFQTVFNSRGLASGGGGNVVLRNSLGDLKRVTLWTTGHLKTQTSTDGGASWS
jgi:prepilin-type N-terminal cleavage/methylation domain-containing protein